MPDFNAMEDAYEAMWLTYYYNDKYVTMRDLILKLETFIEKSFPYTTIVRAAQVSYNHSKDSVLAPKPPILTLDEALQKLRDE